VNLSVINAADERQLAAEAILPKAERKKLAAMNRENRWRTSSLMARIVFFFLTCVGLTWIYGFMRLISLPAGFLTGVGAIVACEYLLQKKRFLRTGIEEALYLGGLVSLISTLPSSGKPEAVLVFVATFLWCGLRLSQGFFLGIASLLLVVYAGWRAESLVVAGFAGLFLLAMAIVIDRSPLQRPSLDFAVSMHMILLPTASAFLLCDPASGSSRPDIRLILLIGIASLALLAFALVRQVSALIPGSALNVVLTSGELLSRTALSGEAVALIIGVATFATALMLERKLRGRTIGFTSDRFETKPLIGAIEMAGAAALAHETQHVDAAPAAEPQPAIEQASAHDGSFGGAGATGEF
jgi:hypothetical protein